MPILKVSLWTGRTKAQKAELAKALTDTMVDVAKMPPQSVTIQFEELPKEDWATLPIDYKSNLSNTSFRCQARASGWGQNSSSSGRWSCCLSSCRRGNAFPLASGALGCTTTSY